MPIDFPPPPTPVQGDITSLQADANQGAVSVVIAGYTLYVHAPGVLDAPDITAATAGLDDVSNAVRSLAIAAQRKGLLVPKTLYVRNGNDIYVSIYPGSINTVSAPEPLLPYFEKFGKDEPVTIGAFEKMRLLGGIHATRMGAGYTPVFAPAEGSAYDMTLTPTAEGVNPGSVRVNLSNVGNRFTGREFLDLDARRGTPQGDEFSVLARTAASVLELDDVEPGSDYHEYQLGWSRVTPFGLFGVSGRYLDYRQQSQGFGFNGELWTVDAGYTAILASSATSRVTLQTKMDYIYKRLELDANGQLFQEEPYPSIEIGAAWSTSFRMLSESWLSVASLSARQGVLANESSALTNADLDYWLVRPGYSLRSQGAPFTFEVQAALQYADVTVPEQQQWIVGGIGSMHAYVPGVALGDRGLLARVVAEYNPTVYYGLTFKPRAFVEFAAAEYANNVATQSDGVQSLTDIGAELVVGFEPWFETALAAALPLQHSNVSKQARDDARADFFFRLTAKF